MGDFSEKELRTADALRMLREGGNNDLNDVDDGVKQEAERLLKAPAECHGHPLYDESVRVDIFHGEDEALIFRKVWNAEAGNFVEQVTGVSVTSKDVEKPVV